ncbi:hypothetical protein PR048_027438 [Dryococelus australis]|uniref:E3 ubiquitin-protein ligase n=1 Tax=Dryococelus australis TaxID=614101 RepID=A0ABQ9GFG1_9NEOP|nr:hypothetical protein PR048_027438 [Dryococelus australis]
MELQRKWFKPELVVVDPEKHFQDNLLSVLTCPRCREYLEPPITLCEKGHNVCRRCRPRMRHCPICSKKLLDTRNVSLEAIARDTLFPCRYAAEGCRETRQLGDIAAHHAVCALRVYSCPWVAERCTWRGAKTSMADHLRAAHASSFVEPLVETDVAASWHISKADCFNERSHAVTAFGEVFLVDRMFDVPQKKLCLAVRQVGCKDKDAANFRYCLRLSRNGGAQQVDASCLVHAHAEDVVALFQTHDCVRVDFDTLVSFSKGARSIEIVRLGPPQSVCTLLDI